ncbi:cell division protein SepF [Salsipaludibacter albus]|uniref:cell division protein SepF n=1 Tax=Salsipaludibacter albus TaxID=2849650 RepID=UPI001EE4ADFD|nr:cell division protein SepF [Salsipaludibacter albus]MBY5163209.1 cell division protein SepF [Salsipaludibacter albus]
MSMWRKTLVYLGLVEEPDEYDEMPERFEEQARAARPAMHDTTGPIAVVRPDDEDDFGLSEVVGRSAGGGYRNSGSGGDLTEPVSQVALDEERRSAASSDRPRRRAPAEDRPARREDGSNVRALRPDDDTGHQMPAGLGRRVAIVAVTDYEDSAREVGSRYRQGSPVVFDLTDAPSEARKRVLDFVAGTTFALQGEMMKVGAKSFLIVPRGTEIPEREWTRLQTLGYRP